MDFLSKIIATKRKRLATAKAKMSLDQVRQRARKIRIQARPYRLASALQENGINVIAEFKRQSPSKGTISSSADPSTIAKIYERGGAAAISVLTEGDHFGGSLEDLRLVREASALPLLRKDFILDEYQVYESAAASADALLLIVAALRDDELSRLRALAEDGLGMDALVEVHTKAELDRAVKCGARVIGVNNRDLRTFKVSIETSMQLARFASRETIMVSESGLDPQAVQKLKASGYCGFLVGESLMRADDPGQKLRELVEVTETPARRIWVKICGITNREDAKAAVDAGADMLGFNFYPRSPRFIEPKAAARIISGISSVSTVGVFVNESIENILRIREEAGLDGIQLHGDESVEFCASLRKLTQGLLIKAVRPREGFNIETLTAYPTDAIMIDAFDPVLRGGTGTLSDWTIARNAAKELPRLFLAGGLSPENVAAAIAEVQPYAVDACSALETAPGKKSANRIREFVAAVRTSKLPEETSAGEGN